MNSRADLLIGIVQAGRPLSRVEAEAFMEELLSGRIATPEIVRMLLALNQPENALSEYEKSMKIDPNRFNGLAGAAHAAGMAHQTAKANSYYSQLLKNCDGGKHSDRPELRNAKTEVAKNGE